MGWWSEQSKSGELVVGDEPLDLIGTSLEQVADAYQADLGRKPTLEELARIIEIALSTRLDTVLEGAGGKDLGGVAIRLKKQSPRVRLAPGDFFAVPLPSGGYGYGRIKDIMLKSVLLVDFLDLYSESLLPLDRLRKSRVLFEALCGYLYLVDGQWPVLGNVPLPSQGGGLSEKERMEAHISRLVVTFGPTLARDRLEERLRDRHRIPRGRHGDP